MTPSKARGDAPNRNLRFLPATDPETMGLHQQSEHNNQTSSFSFLTGRHIGQKRVKFSYFNLTQYKLVTGCTGPGP